MNHESLWAPWRMAYLRELERKADGGDWSKASAGNFLVEYWASPEDDTINHVVWRDGHGMILLNRYPYANGHLLVALGEPRPTLIEYQPAQRAAFWNLVEVAMHLLENALRPQGINMGINQGRAAGAGVPEHLHGHVLPRWSGDTNFMTVVPNVRVMPDALDTMATRLRKAATREA